MARKAVPAETTPLLGEDHSVANGRGTGSGSGSGSYSDSDSASTAVPVRDDGRDDEKPLPKMQVALLCFARLVEPIAFFCVFPYINEMVQDNGSLADTDVGFYSGSIESLFSLTQALVMLGWGRAADRVGRKPVLVLSLVGMSGATALFGLAHTLGQMIAFRCLAGVFSGTIVTIRTMLAEQSTPATQARVFSWFAVSGNLGIFLGPLLGGALAAPLGRRPPGRDDSGLPFFARYPYALPGFVVAGLGFLAATMAFLFVEETLVRKPARPAAGPMAAPEGEVVVQPPMPPPSAWELFKVPGVPIVLYVYAHIMLLAFSYTALVPVFWFTPVSLGGLGFTPGQIAAMLGLTGAGQALWLVFVFPPLHYRVGTNGVMRLCANAYPAFMAVSPLASLLLRVWDARTLFWVVLPPVLVIGSGVSMCFTAVQLAVNDTAPSPQQLGTLNALALTGASAIRAFAPALFTTLYAINARTQWLGGYAIWVLIILIALGYTVAAHYLPDYEALKKARSEPNSDNSGRSVPDDVARHRHGKKYLYLEPPIHGSKTVRTRVTTIVPPPPPPPPPPVQLRPLVIQAPPPALLPPPPVVVEVAPPQPPPPVEVPVPEPEPEPVPEIVDVSDDDTVDVIAVDVEPEPERPIKPRKKSRRREVERETVYVERERLVPVHVPVPMPMSIKMKRRQPSPLPTPPPLPPPPPRQPEYETFRYINAPRRAPSPPPPLLPSPPRAEEWETHDRIVIREREGRRPKEYYRY
ncbi:hypothetical protein SCUCBS95973_004253 [Sporothrix curviconia]|uniref:Major facilitator superfamily (MFS) profile domain-containing protein n=1 Tax=Sporothrix curviconia TaxID=1260050 RepID=A0ABP0BM48_9PEZI